MYRKAVDDPIHRRPFNQSQLQPGWVITGYLCTAIKKGRSLLLLGHHFPYSRFRSNLVNDNLKVVPIVRTVETYISKARFLHVSSVRAGYNYFDQIKILKKTKKQLTQNVRKKERKNPAEMTAFNVFY